MRQNFFYRYRRRFGDKFEHNFCPRSSNEFEKNQKDNQPGLNQRLVFGFQDRFLRFARKIFFFSASEKIRS